MHTRKHPNSVNHQSETKRDGQSQVSITIAQSWRARRAESIRSVNLCLQSAEPPAAAPGRQPGGDDGSTPTHTKFEIDEYTHGTHTHGGWAERDTYYNSGVRARASLLLAYDRRDGEKKETHIHHH